MNLTNFQVWHEIYKIWKMYKIEIKKSLKNFHTFIKLRIEKYKGYTYSNTVKNTQLGIIVILDNTVEW